MFGLAFTSTMLGNQVTHTHSEFDKRVAARRRLAEFREIILKTRETRDMILRSAETLNIDFIVMRSHFAASE
jgi:hypothetical protein